MTNANARSLFINGSGGGGGSQNLSQVLTVGNANTGIPILGTLLLQADNPFGSIILANSVGQPIINTDNTDNLTVLDAAAFLSANFGTRLLTDPTGANSIGWNSRILYDAAGDSILDWSTGAVIVNDIYSLPTTDGTLGQVMKTDGSGTLTWQDPDTGGSPSWQDTLINSSTLLQDNVITGGAHSFIFNDVSLFEIDTDAFVVYNSAQTVPLLTITPANISFNTENVSSFLTFNIDSQGAYYHQSNDSTTSNTIFQQDADGSLSAYVINGGNVFPSLIISSGGGWAAFTNDGTSSYSTLGQNADGQTNINVVNNSTSFNVFNVNNTGQATFSVNDGTTQLTVLALNTDQTIRIADAYTLPNTDGAANYVLTTDGFGIVTWQPSGGGSAQTWQDTLVTGSVLNQINIIDGGAFNFTMYNVDTYNFATNNIFKVSDSTGNPMLHMNGTLVTFGATSSGNAFNTFQLTTLGAWYHYSNDGTTQTTISSQSQDGTLTLNKYGVGAKTGTPTYNLSVDSSGNVIETTGSSPTFQDVLINGTNLTQANLIDCGNHYFSLTDAAGIDISTNSSYINIIAASSMTLTASGGALNITCSGLQISSNPGTLGQVITSHGSGTSPLWNNIPIASVHTIFTPTTGGTITLINGSYNIINPAGALLALTINLPSAPADNDMVIIKFTKAVTTVTYSGGTISDSLISPIAGGMSILVYDSGTTTWY